MLIIEFGQLDIFRA